MSNSKKVAIVTGSGRGIGKAIALKLAAVGNDIVVCDIDGKTVHNTADEIRAMNQQSLEVVADVGSATEVDRLFAETLKSFGRVDILINNAGITHPAVSILDLDLEYLDSVMTTNYKGVYLCSRRAGKEMVKQKAGCIVNISSITGLVPLPLVVYGPMKSAVNMLTKILAREWAHMGVRVNAIAPGYVMTPLAKSIIDKGERDITALTDRIPMHSFMEPEDIAEAVLFFVSDAARYVTGDIMAVDAGWTADGGWSGYGQ
ncbi:MAG: SDR family oxidoreductase [Deltaproteobacteria bacterium]|jgi:NAD(P)-dependent dehydrogenase (short-subunit alcohol dehydrogenase family)|nr:SDR family oxidoreductase [Deltaproteobacteria bacterium]MBT4641341.1 SDR family oxidoreductase [Deltaproteobacteria bacterium]MBT7714781.1 SDR family oxidoreductase [Deltaproteobacteria bacterium]